MRKFKFGKYKGRFIVEIIYENIHYIKWCLDNNVISLLSDETIIYQNRQKSLKIDLSKKHEPYDSSDDDYIPRTSKEWKEYNEYMMSDTYDHDDGDYFGKAFY